MNIAHKLHLENKFSKCNFVHIDIAADAACPFNTKKCKMRKLKTKIQDKNSDLQGGNNEEHKRYKM